VSTRVYYPKTLSKERPLLIYYHGGGFVFGRPEDYDDFLVELVRRLNITVVSVEYNFSLILKLLYKHNLNNFFLKL
jgi:acetyl esterase